MYLITCITFNIREAYMSTDLHGYKKATDLPIILLILIIIIIKSMEKA